MPRGTLAPRQLQLEKRSGKLFWSDREGTQVLRSNPERFEIETLVNTSLGRFATRIESQEMVCRHCGGH